MEEDGRGVFAPTGQVGPKFQVEGIAATNHSSCQYIRMWAQVSFVLSQLYAFDRRTDISHMAKTALHGCSAVKTTG